MDVLEAIERRRAIKQFDPNHEMTDEEIERLMSYALLAPTAYNIQNWRFVLPRDPDLRKRIREASFDQPKVTDASLLVILCGDLKAWEKSPERYWKSASKDIQDYILPLIDNYYRDKPRVMRDEVMRSAGIAAQTIMLAAQDMGYESCPMDGFDFDAVARLIGLPDDVTPAMFVAVGKKAKDPWPRGGQLPMEEVVFFDRYE